MLYNSVEFLALMTATFLGASWLSAVPRRRLLLLASLVFYGSWNPAYLLLLLSLIFVNYRLGRQAYQSPNSSWIIPVACGFNLGLLAWFKYARFISDNMTPLLKTMGIPSDGFGHSIVLPLAISFITFQGLAYVIDVARGETPAKDLETFALFLSFFLFSFSFLNRTIHILLSSFSFGHAILLLKNSGYWKTFSVLKLLKDILT